MAAGRRFRCHDSRFGIESHRFREGLMHRPAREHFHPILFLCPAPRYVAYLPPGHNRAEDNGDQTILVDFHDLLFFQYVSGKAVCGR